MTSFTVSNSAESRLAETGENHDADNFLVMSAFDVFGTSWNDERDLPKNQVPMLIQSDHNSSLD
jgi:hypothetical protein